MPRSFKDIKLEMTTQFMSEVSIIDSYGLITGQTFEQQFSVVSLENILFSIIALALFFHEQIVSKNALNSRPQNLPNTIDAILAFHDGLDLKWKDGQFVYDFTGVSDAAARKIIARCAILENVDGILVIKVARTVNNVLQPLLSGQLLRLEFYIKQIVKVPGVVVEIINQEADLIKIKLRIYVDPLIIDLETGNQLNTTETVNPTKLAIAEYLANLEFNGAFVSNFFTRKIEDKEGINLATIEVLQWSYDALPFTDFVNFEVPKAGYYKINDADLEIIYEPYVLVNA